MKPLYLDIETTGLIPKGAEWRDDYEDFPFLVSISWIFNGRTYDHLIKPEGYDIPKESEAIHGISYSEAIYIGIPFVNIIYDIIGQAENATHIIGHNLHFDISVIKANILKYNGNIDQANKALAPGKRICTMLSTMQIVKATHPGTRRIKWPTLQELHEHLFGELFDDAHSSKADIEATKRCHEALIERGLI